MFTRNKNAEIDWDRTQRLRFYVKLRDLSLLLSLCLRKLSNSRASAKAARWSKEGNFFWADPANWNGSSIAAPHLERVPCRRDDVILPSASRTLSALLPVRQIEVRSIRLSNEEEPFAKWEWESFRDRREFSRGRFTVRYARDRDD